MVKIDILNAEDSGRAYKYSVALDEEGNKKDFQISLDKDYKNKLASDKVSPEDFVKECFKFLLEREPKESILSDFNIKVISKYFPEFEEEIIKRF